jgi:hypothetical protein
LIQLPNHIHPYIDLIVDADGNCGLPAIASLLGYGVEGWSIVRRELHNELKKNNSLYEKLFEKRLQEVRDSLMRSRLGVQFKERRFIIPAN